ncbi:S-adenosyl-L-methionine-dependent methyltransferase [Mycena sanguinolenta]|uniref:S-adenosyl-L-methionine-dependent methyltransferase n=1 Tax=Mycena sanguinolenta TaxID=230812 RepID=A0A8H7DIW0_9AGAR|nr:S-adenosyl-L-methionine-dependent methyltransferase [Mycena sanguinolenta]
MSTPIRQLLVLITQAVETLEAASQTSGTTLPDLHTPFTPSSEAFRANAEAAEAARIISAAALQLEAIVTPPLVSLYRTVAGHFRSAALRICLESNVAEILREAGPEGLHVKDIAAKNGQDPERLARFMRYLATHHVFREISPNVFGHTRISSMLDTHKSSAEIFADPEHKHDGTMGLAALAAHQYSPASLDETFKASAYAWETLSDPATRGSGDPAKGKPKDIVSISPWKEPKQLYPPEAVLNAYDWDRLSPGSLVVDVGGGVGTASLILAAKFPELKFLVQDLESAIEQGKKASRKVWNEQIPTAISSGQVTLQAHDFFTPQPQTGAAVYFIKNVLHDWSDEYCVKILSQLSAAAAPASTLLLLECLLPLATNDPSASEEGLQEAPAPLLANYGGTNDMGYMLDFAMFLMFNSQERTRMQFVNLLERSGWEFVAVHRRPGDSTSVQCIEAKKAARTLAQIVPTAQLAVLARNLPQSKSLHNVDGGLKVQHGKKRNDIIVKGAG